ncbi:MAG: LPS export ABC transporter periplasmic protein LptC [Bacteroidetes bacterium]|nr:LPS export ABC transporter periplasmic protein LptC [Bacteroidota bacterium]
MNTRKVLRMPFQAIALLSGFFMFFSSCDMKEEKQKVEKMMNDTVFGEYAETVEMQFNDSGVQKAILYAPVLERYQTDEPYTLFEKGVTGYFYGPSGKVENSLKAKWGKSLDKKKIIELRNDVQLLNSKQERLHTDKLFWDQNTGKIYTDEFVKITSPKDTIMGIGFEANQDFSEYRIFKVKGDLSINEEDQ